MQEERLWLTEDLQSYIPMVCTNSPLSGQAFCKEHCQKVSSLGYPTDLKDFLKSCSSERQIVNPREYSKPMRQRVDEVIHEISENTPTGASTNPKNFDLNKNLNMNLILIET